MMIHGLISDTDANTIMKTLKLVMDEFSDLKIYTTEIGIYEGSTSRGINWFIGSQGRTCIHTAIDNEKDKTVEKPFPECKLIIGNSNEVYNQIEDESQHMIFQDACHCFPCVVSSHFCYADKLKVGGFMVWHDTGKHLKPFKDFQHGDKENPDAYISCRKALHKIGMLGGVNYDWTLIFDEADETNEGGGICVFKKLF